LSKAVDISIDSLRGNTKCFRDHSYRQIHMVSPLSVSGKPFGVTINKMSLAVFSGQALSVICSYS